MTSPIAAVSLTDPIEDLADKLGESFGEYGFAVVQDHGIDQDLIAKAEELSRAFFALPEDVKRSYFIQGGGGARGYTPFKTEVAKGYDKKDLKEFWHIGRTLPEGDPLSGYMAPNVWPDEVDGFRETFETLYGEFEKAGAKILSALAVHLGLAPDWFDATVEKGNSVMRLLAGSVIPGLITLSTVPVLVVRHGTLTPAHGGAVHRHAGPAERMHA